MYLAGGDAVTATLENQGVAVSQEIIDAKKHELGLDKPFIEQYGTWLVGLMTGDMGVSYVSGKEVFATFTSKLPATIVLTIVSVLLTIVISVPLGILAAVKQNRFTDYLIRVLSFIGNSLPNFFVALLLILVFSLYWENGLGFTFNSRNNSSCFHISHCHVLKIHAPNSSYGTRRT